jgi:8-oxo-dGTP pyrophosphatase MutT (NUDIX family)
VNRVAPWRPVRSRSVHDCRVFDLREVRFAPPDGRAEADFYVVEAPDWVNVVPLTPEGRVVFVRQYRFGVRDVTLEIPGGMCDPGENPAAAAARELLEETGYRGAIEPLGSVHPNPAIQSNRCWSFLARDVERVADPDPDPHEQFHVELRAAEDVPELIRSGEITHSLVVTAFHLLGLAR